MKAHRSAQARVPNLAPNLHSDGALRTLDTPNIRQTMA